jgi:enoyl-CoA hydratase
MLTRKMPQAGRRAAVDPDRSDLGFWVSPSLGELFGTDDHREGVSAFLDEFR